MRETQQIAKELVDTALGLAFFGEALRMAMNLPCVSPEEIALLDRWVTGSNKRGDTWDLQRLANRLLASGQQEQNNGSS